MLCSYGCPVSTTSTSLLAVSDGDVLRMEWLPFLRFFTLTAGEGRISIFSQ